MSTVTAEELLTKLNGKMDKLDELSKTPEQLAALRSELDESKRTISDLKTRLDKGNLKLPGSEDVAKDFSLCRIASALAESTRTGTHPKNFAPLEWEVSEQTRKLNHDAIEEREGIKQRTTQTAGTPSLGGFVIPTPILVDKLYPLLYANMVLKDLGATMMTNIEADSFEVPRFTGGTTAYWVGEDQASTESNATLGSVKFSTKEIAVLVAISNRLKKFNPMVEQGLLSDIAQQIALGIETAALIGKGTEYQPQGIIKGAGGSGTTYPWLEGNLDSTLVGTDVNLGSTGGAMTFVNALSFIGGLQDLNALKGNLGFVMPPAVFRKWQQDTTNQYTTVTPLSQAKIEEISGYKVRTTTSLPVTLAKTTTTLGPVIFGNWADLWIPMFGGIEILASNTAYNPTTGKSGLMHRLTHISVSQMVDCGVMRAASFAASNEATTV